MEEISKNETTEKTETSETPKKGEKDLTAVLSYIGILFLVPLLVRKDDAFVQFHAKQGLVLFVAEVATMMIAWIPFLGWLVGLNRLDYLDGIIYYRDNKCSGRQADSASYYWKICQEV